MTNIVVTQEMISEGVRRECHRCPVALAVKAVVRDGIFVRVGTGFLYLGDHRRTVTMPVDAQWFIRAFDCGRPVQPISFPLDIPEEFLK